mmetsp:Transcript_80900/g.142660  ORF Transcript_80900/g.142660 Transcript_80900/m.142660 type:complete len:205 (+) Transcript_80900:1566-2180(+)
MRSTREVRDTNSPLALTMGNFPIFFVRMSSLASARVQPSFPTIRLSFTITSLRSCVWSVKKSVSLDVTRPSNLEPSLPSSVTGNPVNLSSSTNFRTSPTVLSGLRVTGSAINPLRNFFTCRTKEACSSASQLLWITPMPPRSAMFTAMFTSVTVSIGELTNGVLSRIFLVKLHSSWTTSGEKSMYPGSMRKSLYVRPSPFVMSW